MSHMIINCWIWVIMTLTLTLHGKTVESHDAHFALKYSQGTSHEGEIWHDFSWVQCLISVTFVSEALYALCCYFRLCYHINTLRPRQNGWHFADIFKCIFLNEKGCILIKISVIFVPMGPINNIAALVQIMAWRRSGHKPLSEPNMA